MMRRPVRQTVWPTRFTLTTRSRGMGVASLIRRREEAAEKISPMTQVEMCTRRSLWKGPTKVRTETIEFHRTQGSEGIRLLGVAIAAHSSDFSTHMEIVVCV